MIDLSGLNISDVLIIVQQGDIIITSAKQDVKDDVKALPCPINVLSNGPKTNIICCDALPDCLVLAERLATTWEGQGYVVQRVYATSDASSRKPIQSFVLV